VTLTTFRWSRAMTSHQTISFTAAMNAPILPLVTQPYLSWIFSAAENHGGKLRLFVAEHTAVDGSKQAHTSLIAMQ
jgi:hypothetical protein